MKHSTIVVLGLSLVSITAFAGKEEREYMKAKLGPAIVDAQSKFKASCGCPLEIKVTESTLKDTNDMYVASHIVSSISENAGQYCIDAPSKAAMCQLHTLEIGKGDKPEFTFNAGRGVSMHDGQSYVGWDVMAHALDK